MKKMKKKMKKNERKKKKRKKKHFKYYTILMFEYYKNLKSHHYVCVNQGIVEEIGSQTSVISGEKSGLRQKLPFDADNGTFIDRKLNSCHLCLGFLKKLFWKLLKFL